MAKDDETAVEAEVAAAAPTPEPAPAPVAAVSPVAGPAPVAHKFTAPGDTSGITVAGIEYWVVDGILTILSDVAPETFQAVIAPGFKPVEG